MAARSKQRYVVLFFLDGQMRKFQLAGEEINRNPDFVEENRSCAEEEVVVLRNEKENRTRISELMGEIACAGEEEKT